MFGLGKRKLRRPETVLQPFADALGVSVSPASDATDTASRSIAVLRLGAKMRDQYAKSTFLPVDDPGEQRRLGKIARRQVAAEPLRASTLLLTVALGMSLLRRLDAEGPGEGSQRVEDCLDLIGSRLPLPSELRELLDRAAELPEPLFRWHVGCAAAGVLLGDDAPSELEPARILRFRDEPPSDALLAANERLWDLLEPWWLQAAGGSYSDAVRAPAG